MVEYIKISEFNEIMIYQVKADRDSSNRLALIQAKNDVSSTTADLVASARSFLKDAEDQSKLSSSSFFNLSKQIYFGIYKTIKE